MFDPKTGLVAGVLAAFYGMFIFYSSLLLGVTLILFLNLLMLVCLVEGMRDPRWWKWILAGVCCGLSAGARGTVILFVPFALFALWSIPGLAGMASVAHGSSAFSNCRLPVDITTYHPQPVCR